MHKKDWGEELKSEDDRWKRGIGPALSPALIHGILPEDLRMQVERQVTLIENGRFAELRGYYHLSLVVPRLMIQICPQELVVVAFVGINT